MSRVIDSCSHTNEIIDARCGAIVCTECGLVIDAYYESDRCENKYIPTYNLPESAVNYIYEMIERLNIPSGILTFIFKKIKEKRDGGKINETFLARCLYTTLCELGIPFSIKDICSVTGVNSSKISIERKTEEKTTSSSVVIINKEDILERACSKLSINYKNYTLIKESIVNKNNGFNPSTVISAYIYVFCKKNKIKISLKQISDVTGISCMSITRFIKKNDISPRT
ncbi:MAG: hypothetical protein Q8O25_11865 [Sulfurisoma sp.]|nr:hypothetical protein [Sulfurisoma sp.]